MKQGLGFLIFTLGSLLVAQQPHLAINPKVLQTHVEFLSDDLLEGRGTGERGGELTVRYLETQSQAHRPPAFQWDKLPSVGENCRPQNTPHQHPFLRGPKFLDT